MLTSDLTQRLFRTPAQFAEFFGSGKQSPVDFSSRQLLLVSPGPRSSTGYSVRILSVTERDDAITVKVRERTPTLADHVEARVTYPYRLLSAPKRVPYSRRLEWISLDRHGLSGEPGVSPA